MSGPFHLLPIPEEKASRDAPRLLLPPEADWGEGRQQCVAVTAE